jgi:hypothetical protein
MALLQRITTPIAGLLPDLTNVPPERQVVGGIIASVVVHFFLLLFFVAGARLLPESSVSFAKPRADLQPLEVVIMSMPEPDSTPEVLTPEQLQARAQRQNIDSTGLAKANEAPKEALFESDQDMQAASEKLASGDAPLPSQEGRELPFTGFSNQQAALGAGAIPAPTVPPQPVQPLVQPQPAQPQASGAEPSEAAADPAKPQPAPEVLRPDETQIAVAQKIIEAPVRPRARPRAGAVEPRPLPDAPPKDRMELAKLTTPAPRPLVPSESAFQPHDEKTRVDGAITNRGRPAVDAVRTPLSVYRRQVKAAIASRWYYYVKNHPDRYTLGMAAFSYSITKAGKIVNLRRLENTSNSAFAIMCEQCIREAEIGPPPDEAQSAMVNGLLADEASFILY